MWWYFCGARSYCAMRLIQSQILVVASGMPYLRTATKARLMCCLWRNCPLGPVIPGRMAASSAWSGRPGRAGRTGERYLMMRHQQASCSAVMTA